MDELIDIFKDLSAMKEMLASDATFSEEINRNTMSNEIQVESVNVDESSQTSPNTDIASNNEQVIVDDEMNEEDNNSDLSVDASVDEDSSGADEGNEEESSGSETKSCSFFTVC